MEPRAVCDAQALSSTSYHLSEEREEGLPGRGESLRQTRRPGASVGNTDPAPSHTPTLRASTVTQPLGPLPLPQVPGSFRAGPGLCRDSMPWGEAAAAGL